MHADVNASYLVKEIPDALIASLSLSFLDKANLNSLDRLEGRSWSRTQVNPRVLPVLVFYSQIFLSLWVHLVNTIHNPQSSFYHLFIGNIYFSFHIVPLPQKKKKKNPWWPLLCFHPSSWSLFLSPQSVYLLKKIVGNGLKPEQIRWASWRFKTPRWNTI